MNHPNTELVGYLSPHCTDRAKIPRQKSTGGGKRPTAAAVPPVMTTLLFFIFYVVPLVETFFLTTFYGLYFIIHALVPLNINYFSVKLPHIATNQYLFRHLSQPTHLET